MTAKAVDYNIGCHAGSCREAPHMGFRPALLLTAVAAVISCPTLMRAQGEYVVAGRAAA